MTNSKKMIILICSVCAFVVIAVCISIFLWGNTFDEEWTIGQTQSKIEQRYGEADFTKDNYIEYWEKQKLGYKINRIFFEELVKSFDYRQIVTILGNHEYWPSEFGSVPETIYSNYYRMLRGMRIAILQNDLLVLKDGERIAVREEELIKADVKEIREFCIGCSVLIYGGTAFSGLNADFNCNSGIYRNTISDRMVEGELSERFSYLYNKLLDAIPEFNLIVLSHTPKIDWTTQDYHPGWHYIHGHTHRNEFISENNVNVYSDNQIGYKNGSIHLKKFNLSVISDIFIDYEDGIHNITIDQYRSFYRMLRIQMTFNGVPCTRTLVLKLSKPVVLARSTQCTATAEGSTSKR